MAGGRSVGCRTCKKRKIKCDERRPTCLQCEKSHRKCSGVLSRFVYEAQMRKLPDSGPTLPSGQFEEVDPITNSQDVMVKFNAFQSKTTEILYKPVPLCNSEVLSGRLSKALQTTDGTTYALSSLGEFWPEVPCRVGHNLALDEAVQAILFVHLDFFKPHPSGNIEKQLRHYGNALHHLRKELEGPSNALTSETLCTALVLCILEAMNPKNGSPAWHSHARGVMSLFKAYGPERIKSRFDFLILHTQSYPIIASCLLSGDDCFIASPTWLPIYNKCVDFLTQPCERLNAKIAPIYAALPSLIRAARTVNGSDEVKAQTLLESWMIQVRLLALEPDVNAILRDQRYIEKVPSNDATFPFPTCYRYLKLEVGHALSMYWRIVITINEILRSLGAEYADIKVISSEAAKNICMSIEYGRLLNPMGDMFAIMNLLIAHPVSAAEAHEWIIHVIKETSRSLDMAYLDVLCRFLSAMNVRTEHTFTAALRQAHQKI